MPLMATVRYSVTLSFSGAGGDSGMGGGGDIQKLEDLILTWFLIWDACTRSCLGRIGT